MRALQADLELALATVDQRPLETVFIGGGTPSLFSPDSIAALLESLQRAGRLLPDAEITLEANPGALDAGRFRGYRDAGVNRLSLGVQSFDDDSLRRLGRIHDAATARRAAEQAGAIFSRLNLDLMHGLPGQTTAGAIRDVETALRLAPGHLSCYQLTLEPNTVFSKFPPELPADTVLANIEAAFLERLEGGGYENYEVSAHALPEQQCRHNRHYWEFADYLGIGAGAHSKLNSLPTCPPGVVMMSIVPDSPPAAVHAEVEAGDRHVVRPGRERVVHRAADAPPLLFANVVVNDCWAWPVVASSPANVASGSKRKVVRSSGTLGKLTIMVGYPKRGSPPLYREPTIANRRGP